MVPSGAVLGICRSTSVCQRWLAGTGSLGSFASSLRGSLRGGPCLRISLRGSSSDGLVRIRCLRLRCRAASARKASRV